ncbi:PP2C family protein-serine/threonine phosphatase [Candidatus Omnitrophota bacterium]
MMLKDVLKKIPHEYLDDFHAEQTLLIKARVRVFCILTISLYFLTAIINVIVNPETPMIVEIIAGLVLTVGGALTLFLNRRTKTLLGAKLNAYLFTIILVVLFVRLGIYYAEDPMLSAAGYVFTLFLVSVTIPWSGLEIIPLGFIHIIAFSTEFLYVKYGLDVSGELYTLTQYMNGFIFITLAFIICIVVRGKETERDVENFILFRDVEAKNKQMTDELEWATRIHKTIIPASVSTDEVDIGVTYLPVYYMGGDYTRFNFLEHDKLIFIISDVTGHGVPAALLVNRIHAEFERLGREGNEPGELLRVLNEFIKEDFEGSDMFLSAFCGLIDMKKMTLKYSNYGHPPQYVYSEKDKKVHSLGAQTSLLGLPLDDDEVYQDEINLTSGDRILLYTDGITETFDSAHDEYGYDRLKEFIKKHHTLGVQKFNDRLIKDLDEFKSEPFKDDICMLDMIVKGHKSLFHWGEG